MKYYYYYRLKKSVLLAKRDFTLPPARSRGLARIQKLPVQNDHFSQFCQSSSYLSHYKTKQFHQSWQTSASLQGWQTGL